MDIALKTGGERPSDEQRSDSELLIWEISG